MWIELSFTVDGEWAECWSDALLEAGALSAQAEDADADSPAEVALFGEPGEPVASARWQRTTVTALIDRSVDPAVFLTQAAGICGRPLPDTVQHREVAQEDWVRLTQSQFDPITIGDRLLIAPSWHGEALERGRQAGREVIELDPGLAFGTGSHPTTQMCLEWLDRCLPPHASVIDYGCGSGILAIAAARLGAADVLAVDIDPQAVESTVENALRNHAKVRARQVEQPIDASFDVVLANILANPLRVLAPLLSALVAPGGTLVLAGLLSSQTEEIAACYPGLGLEVFAEREGWACLVGKRPR